MGAAGPLAQRDRSPVCARIGSSSTPGAQAHCRLQRGSAHRQRVPQHLHSGAFLALGRTAHPDHPPEAPSAGDVLRSRGSRPSRRRGQRPFRAPTARASAPLDGRRRAKPPPATGAPRHLSSLLQPVDRRDRSAAGSPIHVPEPSVPLAATVEPRPRSRSRSLLWSWRRSWASWPGQPGDGARYQSISVGTRAVAGSRLLPRPRSR